MTANFEIDHFFDGIYGSNPQAVHKSDVIRQALATHNLDPEKWSLSEILSLI